MKINIVITWSQVKVNIVITMSVIVTELVVSYTPRSNQVTTNNLFFFPQGAHIDHGINID